MSDNDFTFAWEGADAPGGPWAHLRVLQLEGREEISALYRYEIHLLAKTPAPEVDPRDLIGQRATLRVKTLTSPAYKVVHGVVVEAEELTATQDGMAYRVVLMPPLARARHRRRCRIFLQKTLRQIVDAVLQGDPRLSRADGAAVEDDDGVLAAFAPAAERFTWRVSDPSRLDDPSARAYCVQYNESDLDFVARLLEDEGLSYHFENGQGLCLLVLSDSDAGRSRLEPFEPLGPGVDGREVTHVKLGARMRSKAVHLGDYNWKRPALDMLAEAARGEDLVDFSYPGGYPDSPAQGAPLASARLERLGIEADYALISGRCRALSAGSVFRLQHGKHRYEGEYLVTRLRVEGHQEGSAVAGVGASDVPFRMEAECARRAAGESRFRPARSTARPRITGSQTAFVTADPTTAGAEIHVGGPPQAEIGCVRLRFHWDREEARLAKEPSSAWVRVSQGFAGVGQGAVWHPRVGVEVIVEFEEGDPDRPIVTGRVYNGANLPPAPSAGAPTISTMKSMSSPGGGGYNELSFDDATGSEQIKMHAQKDWNSEVGNDRSESIGSNSSSSVGANRSESTGANRSTAVGANNMEVIGANESVSIGANQSLLVGVNQTSLIGANQSTQVGASQTLTVGAAQSVSIAATQDTTIGGAQTIDVGGAQTISIGAAQGLTIGAGQTIDVGASRSATVAASDTVEAGADQSLKAGGPQSFTSGVSQTCTAPLQTFSCTLHTISAGALISAHAGAVTAVGAPLTVTSGEAVLVLTGPVTFMLGGAVSIVGGTVAVNGGSVSVTGGSVTVDGGGSIDMKAGIIKLN